MRLFSRVVAALLACVLVGAPAAAQPSSGASSTTVTTTPFTTPNTDSCPNKSVPPKAIDQSEVPQPGRPQPSALPVPAQPVGGSRLGGCGVQTADRAGPVPKDIAATAWLVADLDSGEVLAAKDPHGRYRPASTIKVLLALVALRELDLRKVVTGTAADLEVDGTRVGIGPGGRYSNLQLMQALLMASGNDAAQVIARQLGGDAATVAKMNAKAAELGALDTRTATPSGLDGPGMSCSAYDLALLFREAMRVPMFAELIRTEQIAFPGYPADPRVPGDKDHPGFAVGNDNQLLFNYDGALGGKTGFTDDARQTFVAGAQRDGRRLVVTLLASEVRPIRPWEQAARLLDYGFALGRSASIGTLNPGTPAPNTVALAAPPSEPAAPGAITANPALPERNTHMMVRLALVLGGALVVVLLLLAASMLNRRR